MTVESMKLPGEPVLLVQFVPPSDPSFEALQMRYIFAHLSEYEEPIQYLIMDLSQANLSFKDVVTGMGEMARTEPPNVRGTFHVGNSEMVRLIGETARQKQYGGLETILFPTVDEALEHIRSLIAEVQ